MNVTSMWYQTNKTAEYSAVTRVSHCHFLSQPPGAVAVALDRDSCLEVDLLFVLSPGSGRLVGASIGGSACMVSTAMSVYNTVVFSARFSVDSHRCRWELGLLRLVHS